MDVVILTFGFQFLDVNNITTSSTRLKKNNKVTNIGRANFTKLVLDVLELLTFGEFHFAIVKIIKQVTCQEGLANT